MTFTDMPRAYDAATRPVRNRETLRLPSDPFAASHCLSGDEENGESPQPLAPTNPRSTPLAAETPQQLSLTYRRNSRDNQDPCGQGQAPFPWQTSWPIVPRIFSRA